ncbi:TonB-dependent receptor plug domain-containing protein [Arcticibacter eurypsychrophilus]|uniref:TonB-dependent receptor plug domain-containing protein n=1 Tax=Arcticibacter eurypsychrophilus TaxID=1434752 RepID=UPI00084DB0EC|nr:TonB-dependent receptor plug domain-containing protein [Arcticibacter eurypsychrophilus]
MRRFHFLILAVFICSAYSFSIKTDDDPLNKIIAKIDKILNDHPQEKVHIHTDKPYYVAGDTIWFKAYIVNARQNRLSALSQILYVDLINEKDSLEKALRLPVVSGLALGEFTLLDSLPEGNYRLRAYTNWMRNFGEEYYFDKIIRVGSSYTNQVFSTVSYTYSTVGTNEEVSANIVYTDNQGQAISGKEVRYMVELDNRNVARGKGTTDREGKLVVKFSNKQPFLLKAGKITTTLELANNRFKIKTFVIKSTNAQVDVQFFPEGGQLINGIRGRVAFKAVGSDGLSRPLSGTITDNENKVITNFKSPHAGMGAFLFTPNAGKTYTAKVTFEDGSQKSFVLPAAISSGYSLIVNNSDEEEINIRISSSPDLIGSGSVTLIAQANEEVLFVGRNTLNKSTIAASIPKNRFPTGIVRLTVFSAAYVPVAERLLFVRHAPALKMDIVNNKTSYTQREKVNMSISVKDTLDKPVQGVFSVAVVNETKVPSKEEDETTILSNLLLSSDLKGYIEKPNYYFTDLTDTKDQELDILMMTQGWSRFTWQNTMNGTFPPITFKPEKSISISGTVTNYGKKPVEGSKVLILASNGSGIILDTVTGADGRFNFDNLQFNDSTRFVVQARTSKNKKNVDIEIDRVPGQLVTKSKNSPDVEININATLLSYLKVRRAESDELRKRGLLRRKILLDEVIVSEKKARVKNSSNLNGAGNADAVILADHLQNCVSLDQCLQGLVAGVIIQGGIAYSTRSMGTPMQLILDGMYVEPDFLTSLNPQDIESIEVLRTIGNTAIYGTRGGGGVLVINTKRGDSNYSYRSFAPGIITYNPQGYSIGRQFYSPNYANPKINTTIPDLRSTILWVPNIITDSLGKATINYFTADDPGEYKVTVEGMDTNGGLLRQIYRFIVK